MKVLKFFAVGLLALTLGACAGGPSQSIDELRQPPSVAQSPMIEQIKKHASFIRKDITVAVGNCGDKTGKFADADKPRYSRAVTQAAPEYMRKILKEAGFVVLNRNSHDVRVIANEHQMGNTYGKTDAQGNPVNTGLVQRNRPVGGITGVTLLVSCAVTSFSPAVTSGGGGAEAFGAGANYREMNARVEVHTAITDMQTEVIDAVETKTFVKGRRAGLTFNRIGSVFGSSSTFISAELGSASQMPVDMALKDAMIFGVASLLKRNKEAFYRENASKVSFDFQVASEEALGSQKPVYASNQYKAQPMGR